jgi:hypothetical protein
MIIPVIFCKTFFRLSVCIFTFFISWITIQNWELHYWSRPLALRISSIFCFLV